MDKAEFIEKAPIYYALGIAVGLLAAHRPSTLNELSYNLDRENWSRFEKQPLVEVAIEILRQGHAIIIIPDDFGPTMYSGGENLRKWIETDGLEKFPLVRKFNTLESDRNWLGAALENVNRYYDALGINEGDFDLTKPEVEWEPIPVDRADSMVQQVTENLEAAINDIEGDNGYAVHAPAEREYVLTQLKSFREIIKTKSEVFWPQVKAYALDPLGRVIKRFGDAAVGIVAAAARQSIIEWLKGVLAKAAGLLF